MAAYRARVFLAVQFVAVFKVQLFKGVQRAAVRVQFCCAPPVGNFGVHAGCMQLLR
jgi:hypothetical protein